MAAVNKLNKIITNINRLPSFVRPKVLTTFFGRLVKFTGTAGVQIESLSEYKAVVCLKNRKPVQNHIGSVHAIANLLIAETASGYVIGMNVPASSVPVIKSVRADYVKRSRGNMKAVAELSIDQVRQIRSQNKGEMLVPVKISDGDGKEPVLVEMLWAWTPSRGKS